MTKWYFITIISLAFIWSVRDIVDKCVNGNKLDQKHTENLEQYVSEPGVGCNRLDCTCFTTNIVTTNRFDK